MAQEKQELKLFWNSFIRAVEAEPHEVASIQGASGFHYRVAALGLDKSRHRLIILTCEDNTRAAVLVQADLQSAFKSVQVITVRADENLTSDASTLEDRKAGLCSVQLKDFSPDEIELFSSGLELEAIRDVLLDRKQTHSLAASVDRSACQNARLRASFWADGVDAAPIFLYRDGQRVAESRTDNRKGGRP